MTAPTIKEQLTQSYVGEMVELFTIDTTSIGGIDVFHFTPSSHTPISFNGIEYTPMPISISGLNRSMDAAPGRVNMQMSSMNGLVAAAVISLGDLVGAKVTHIRTFKNFLDGQEDGGMQQSFPVERFIIYQKEVFSRQAIQWILTTELDRPGAMLPMRQCLKSDVSRNALFCPGMQRSRL